jgi:hypothetical protein
MGATTKARIVSVGSWVKIGSLWPGIWRVSRVLSGFNESRWSLKAPITQSRRTLVFCDRIVNDDWKRSFKTQCCEVSLVTLLDADHSDKLASLLSTDLDLAKAFEEYQAKPHPIDLIANISFGGMSAEAIGQLSSACDQALRLRIEAGLTITEVLEALSDRDLLEYQTKIPRSLNLQLTCLDHEVRSNEFVFRKYRVRNG